MPAKQRMRVQSEKHSKNVNIRGNVPKSEVRTLDTCEVKIMNFCFFNFHRKRAVRDTQLVRTS